MAPVSQDCGLVLPRVALPYAAEAITEHKAIATSTLDQDIPTLVARQQTTVTVTAGAESSGGNESTSSANLSGGAIAGIVIGSVVGILLLIWIIRSCFNLGAPPGERESWYRDVDTKSHGHHHHHHHQRRHDSRRRSASLSRPPPVIIRDVPDTHQQPPTYVYKDGSRRGRRESRNY